MDYMVYGIVSRKGPLSLTWTTQSSFQLTSQIPNSILQDSDIQTPLSEKQRWWGSVLKEITSTVVPNSRFSHKPMPIHLIFPGTNWIPISSQYVPHHRITDMQWILGERKRGSIPSSESRISLEAQIPEFVSVNSMMGVRYQGHSIESR